MPPHMRSRTRVPAPARRGAGTAGRRKGAWPGLSTRRLGRRAVRPEGGRRPTESCPDDCLPGRGAPCPGRSASGGRRPVHCGGVPGVGPRGRAVGPEPHAAQGPQCVHLVDANSRVPFGTGARPRDLAVAPFRVDGRGGRVKPGTASTPRQRPVRLSATREQPRLTAPMAMKSIQLVCDSRQYVRIIARSARCEKRVRHAGDTPGGARCCAPGHARACC